jgi:plastocyanin
LLASVLTACGSPAKTLPTAPPDAVVIVAQGTAFTTRNVAAPAGVEFTLFFENRDNELHNVHISDATGVDVFHGETFTGPEAKVESVPALAAGTYSFKCDIHPDMTGQLVSQ